MKHLLKVMVVIALFFATTFILIKANDLITLADIQAWFAHAKALSPLYIAGLVILLLFLDLFISVPTMTITLLAGYFLGHTAGAFAAITGMMLAGVCGYGLSYRYGESVFNRILKDPTQRQEARASFQEHGFTMILLSRALPMLPEVTACLAGITRMPLLKFLLVWTLNTVPYSLVAAYAGSVSNIDNPTPALYTALGITGTFWLGWFLFRKFHLTKPSL